ncbi:MAG: prolyl oligopeptidase family serine peptidase [Pseudomonadota bacterium]
MRARTLLPILALSGCMNLDSFFFERNQVTSLTDYHDLPVYQGDSPPDWIAAEAVERSLYLEVPSGDVLASDTPPESGEYIHAVFLPAPTTCPVEDCPLIGRDITFLYQHGNSGDLWRYWYRAVNLWSMGANVLIYTWRGYGLSGSEPTRAHVLEDADGAMAYLLTRPEVDPERVVAYGYSTGAIPSSWLVGPSEHRDDFAAVIFESGLDAIDSVMSEGTATDWPTGFFFEDTLFDGPTFLEDADPALPVLFAWGGQDTRVLREQVQRYHDVLQGFDDYTERFGETGDPVDRWLAESGHRNIPDHAFGAENHIADYYDDAANPGHCCVHPLEYEDAANADFLAEVGGTTGEEMAESWRDYRALISGWCRDRFPE